MKKRILKLTAVTTTLALLAGCGTATKQTTQSETPINKEETHVEIEETVGELTPLRVNEVVHSVFYAPQYVAAALGYFEEEGLDVSFATGNGADKSMTALISDAADIALLGTEAGIYVYNEGMEGYPKAFLQLTQRAGNFLIAREELPDFDWADLSGSELIGGRAGGMPQMVLEYVLKENGLTPNVDLEITTNIDFSSTAGAFTGNVGDYTVEFEPVATTLEQNGIGHIVASLGEASGYLPYTVYMAQDSFMEENPEAVLSFTRAIYKGQQFVATHSAAEIAELVASEFPENDLDTLTTIIDRYQSQDTWTTTPVFDEDGFNLLQDIMEDGGELSARVPFSDLVTNEFADTIMEEVEK
ncbi:MAG: ABC transporter substrate-binding protein [Bacillota bacterium]